jgi:hypothetical protein
VAVNKPAQQSSTYTFNGVAIAARAVDGNTDGDWGGNSCMCTNTLGTVEPWWAVDLGGTYDVSEVVIYNRANCCGMC